MGANSFDGYLYLRFFKVLFGISLFGVCVTWPVLFPLNITGGGSASQLDKLSYSNVTKPLWTYGHALVAWVFLGGVMLIITHERMFFVGARLAYYTSALRAKRITSRTVLFMSLPKEYQSEEALRKMLGHTVRRVWMASDCDDLENEVQERDKAAMKLEDAQVKLIKNATTEQAKSTATEKQSSRGHDFARAQGWLKDQKLPTHRLKPLIGKKVKTMDYARDYLPKQNDKIAKQQREHVNGQDSVGAAFVEFDSQYAAQRAFQMAAPSKKDFKPRYVDVQPGEVIWKNLKRPYASIKVLMLAASAAVCALVIFWLPLVAFVGVLTNINYLTNRVPFLSFINDIPGPILGVVTGLLPTIILVVLLILVPIIMRLLAKLAGAPTLSQVELKTQSWYFIFQVIQVFLVTTISSGASSVVTQIVTEPGSAPQLLARNLPKASNFYISYFILLGLSKSTLQLLMPGPLLKNTVLGKLLDKTPRKRYNRWTALDGVGWGSEYPKWTNLGVIAISYSCIAPLVLGFSTVGFLLLYIAFRHQWLFVFGNKVDMKGEAFSRALQQLTTGVYIAIICLIGLFAIGLSNNTAYIGPLVITIVLLVVVIIFQVLTDRALGPLEQNLPLDLLRENESSMWRTPTKGAAHFDQHRPDQHGHQPGDQYDRREVDHTGNTARNHHYIIGDGNTTTTTTTRTTVGGPEYGHPHTYDSAAGKGHYPGTTPQIHGHDPEKAQSTPEYEDEAKDNPLTARMRPLIHKRFYLPCSHSLNFAHSQAQLESDWMEDEHIAYLNPVITSEPPVIWLPRDEMGASQIMVRDNQAAGVRSADEFAWFEVTEKKGKKKVGGVMWDTDRAEEVGRMLERREAGQGRGDQKNDRMLYTTNNAV